MHPQIAAIIVTYKPDLTDLRNLVQRVLPDVDRLIVVDNSGADHWGAESLREMISGNDDTTFVENDDNVGLAAALNLGIECALNSGCDFVMLLDQDSLPEGGMARKLMRKLVELSSSGKVAAVGPRCIDKRSGAAAPFIKIGFPRNRKVWSKEGQSVECDLLITSGSLIPASVLSDVGTMDAKLFIDGIDFDWCFRAAQSGYKLYGMHDAEMVHCLGEASMELPAGWGEVLIHAPLRQYYAYRNSVLLAKRSYVSGTWVAQDVVRLGWKMLRYVLFVRPRGVHFKAMALGILDGAAGRSGQCPYQL